MANIYILPTFCMAMHLMKKYHHQHQHQHQTSALASSSSLSLLLNTRIQLNGSTMSFISPPKILLPAMLYVALSSSPSPPNIWMEKGNCCMSASGPSPERKEITEIFQVPLLWAHWVLRSQILAALRFCSTIFVNSHVVQLEKCICTWVRARAFPPSRPEKRKILTKIIDVRGFCFYIPFHE